MLTIRERIIEIGFGLDELVGEVNKAVSLKSIILAGLKLCLAIAVLVVDEVLMERGRKNSKEIMCPECGVALESKGLRDRRIESLIGEIKWKRRVLRCPNNCEIGQIAPLDNELGLEKNQRVSDEVKELACNLAVFLPYKIAVKLLKKLAGVEVSAKAIWDWVQCFGNRAKVEFEDKSADLEKGESVDSEEIAIEYLDLPLVIGGDGVMVPFRPNKGTPKGKTDWKEVKVGIFARLGSRITKTGKEVSVLLRRRLVAVLGNIDVFKSHMWFIAIKNGILTAKTVAWLSDGGKGFWNLFNEHFVDYAQGILDFYHSAQNLWKSTSAFFDSRTKEAEQWFKETRHLLRMGKVKIVLSKIQKLLNSNTISKLTSKILKNTMEYFNEHIDHMNYAQYKKLGLPIGSGMVESACKWLIQQRFKGVGMRWSKDGFNNLLHLRLAWINETFDDFF